ncbi:hypothetical protein [Coleofasciculus sp. F4-SAH-05]|uniref:hypothetical protein n=1 Tax=Coleofasciculus sp. F4-SAH-05 TaxID=3069525 RepID=UPI0032F65C8C
MKPEQPQPKVSSVFVDQDTASSQEQSQEAPSSSRSVRSRPMNNPLFQQQPTSSMPVDEPDQKNDLSPSHHNLENTNLPKSQPQDPGDPSKTPASSVNNVTPSQSVSGKRKIVQPNHISSVFGGNSQKNPPDEH